MAGRDFAKNELVLKMIQELKNNGIKMEGEFTDDDFDYNLDKAIKYFTMVISEKESYLFDILNKDYDELYKFIHYRANDGAARPYIMVPIDLVSFTIIKYFPDKLEKYLSMTLKTAKKTAKILKVHYENSVIKQAPKK